MSTKRKAALSATAAAQDASDGPISKRRKFEDIEAETPEITTQTGYDLLAQIRKSRDKQGSLISTHFETLPDPKVIPEYYEQIKLPIALDTLEGKLDRHQYASISLLESDVKRMISNAKTFNETSSPIYSDAEKVRKLVSNFMVERNPAYKDKHYQAIATPIPTDQESKPSKAAPHTRRSYGENNAESVSSDLKNGRRASRGAGQTSSELDSQRASSTPALQDTEDEIEGFEGLSFQQAQLKIIRSMMKLTDEDNRLVSANFLNLPPRSLVDYYRLIKTPMCLKKLQKSANGQRGHEPPQPNTLLKSWDEFQQTAELIWNNAREYNEEGSEIVELAEELEEYFHERLAEAKAVVEGPLMKKPLKLVMKDNKTPDPAHTPHLKLTQPKPPKASGMSIDNEALKRQQELVSAGMSGQRRTSDLSRATSQGRTNGTEGTVVNGVKRESSHASSPKLAATLPNGTRTPSMAPPSATNARIASASPRPPSVVPAAAVAPPPPPPPAPTYSSSNFNSQIRAAGKDALNALFTNLNISSRPGTNNSRSFNLDVPASNNRTHQSKTVSLSSQYRQIRIGPTLSPSLLQRPSKTFVTCNNHRISATAQMELDQMKPVYDCNLLPGVNTIEVEVIAGLPRGATKPAGTGTGSDIEIEKTTIYAHLQVL